MHGFKEAADWWNKTLAKEFLEKGYRQISRGGTVGFESDYACWFMWLSTKQPVVALQTCESELIATCTVGCAVEWARQFYQELGYAQGTIEIGVDNKCSMRLLEQGTGSFKRAKHIKVRFFWLKDLIDDGEIVLIYYQV